MIQNIALVSCNNFYDSFATGHPNFGLGYVDLHLRSSEFLSMIQYITTGAAGNFHMINPGQELRSGRFHVFLVARLDGIWSPGL